jgi:hypothetical protein
VSYALVEQPVRRRLRGTWRTLAGAVGLGALLLVAIVAATVSATSAAAGASHRSVPPAVRASTPAPAATAAAAPTGADPVAAFDPEAASLAAAPATTVPVVPPLPRKVMLIGDSVAWTLGGGTLSFPQPDTYVSPFAADRITLWNLARYGCGITPGSARVGRVERPPLGTCSDWERSWAAAVAAFGPDLVVFSEALWETYDHRVDGRLVPFGSAEGDALYLATLERLRTVVTARGARLVLLSAPMYASTEGEYGAEASDYWRYQHLNALQARFAREHPADVSTVDLGGHVCTDVMCHEPLPTGGRLRGDGVHFTPEAAAWIAPWLTQQLEVMPAAIR